MAITGLTVTTTEVREYVTLPIEVLDATIEGFIKYGLPSFISYIGTTNYDLLPIAPTTTAEEIQNIQAKESIINFTLSRLMPTISTFTMDDLPDAQDEFRQIRMYSAGEQNERTDRYEVKAKSLADGLDFEVAARNPTPKRNY